MAMIVKAKFVYPHKRNTLSWHFTRSVAINPTNTMKAIECNRKYLVLREMRSV